MKRSLLILFTCAAAAFSSCLGDQRNDASPTAEGQVLYSIASGQTSLVDDPANIAFRFNILMETAAEQQTNLDNVSVTFDGSVKNLKQFFFGGNLIEQIDDDTWRITFNYENSVEIDGNSVPRSGKFRITTNGKTLGELADGEYWTIDMGLEGYLIKSGDTELNSTFTSYIIKSTGNNSWNIIGNSTAQIFNNQNSTLKADWDFDLTVRQTSGGQTYDEVMAATFEVRGGGSGYIINQGMITFYYDIRDDAPLKFKPSCKKLYMLGGAEIVSLDQIAAIESGLQSNEVKYLWGETAPGSCLQTYVISYNGYTYDSASNSTTEDEN